ncbi:MAG: tetratricopeptide repeat protein [Myxococcota bacterium]
MTTTPPCPEPDGCDWQPEILNGVQLDRCSRCAQVRMDPTALERLTRSPRAPLITDPYGSRPFAPPIPAGGFAPTPGGAPVRTAQTLAPPVTPGEPPPRAATPRPTPKRRLDVDSIIDFDDVDDGDGAPPRRPRPSTPAPALRGVVPLADPIDDTNQTLLPLSAALDHPHDNATWAAEDAPTTVDKTDALGLRAALTENNEPQVGPLDDAWSEDAETHFLEGETEELEQFFTDEAPKDTPPPLFGQGADLDIEEPEWEGKKSPWPMIALVAVVLLLVSAALAVVAVSVMPDLQAQLGLAPSNDTTRTESVPIEAVSEPLEIVTEDGPETEPTPDPVDVATEPIATPVDPSPSDAVASTDPEAPAPESVTPDPVTPEPVSTPAEPAPKPVAPPPAATGYSASIRKGWNAVEGDANAAADHFRGALDAKPGDAEASYGLGYAMLKLGQKNGARAYLCAASAKASNSTKAEIQGILSNAALSCGD